MNATETKTTTEAKALRAALEALAIHGELEREKLTPAFRRALAKASEALRGQTVKPDDDDFELAILQS